MKKKLNSDPELKEYVLYKISLHLKKVTASLKPCVETKNPSAIHDFRISTRKFIASCELFNRYLESKNLLYLKKQLCMLSSSTGSVRDLDISKIYLKKLLKEKPLNLKGSFIKAILKKIRQKRNKKFKKEIKKDIVALIRAKLCKGLINQFKVRKQKSTLENPENILLIKKLVAVKLRRYLNEFYQYRFFLDESINQDDLHKARIILKTIRYTLEEIAGFCDLKIRNFINNITELQHQLGLIHDCDVVLNYLLRLSKTKKLVDSKDILDLIQFIKKDRILKYKETIRFLNKIMPAGFDKKLLTSLNPV
jgi:CHAD domain-containing protein